MIVIPAIDIRGGQVVRLSQGRADRQTVYPGSPLEVARKWDSSGVELIHVVDLDGALEGKPRNVKIVREIVKNIKAKVELGGGIRDEDAIREVLDSGIHKVVIGTKALNVRFLDRAARLFGDRVVVSIDARGGIVRTKGWLYLTGIKALELARRIERSGIRTINYTDISRDGMLEGPNIESLRRLLRSTRLEVIASGGISSIDDVKRLKTLEEEGLKGIIIGKALYENRIDLDKAIRLCAG